MIKTIKNKYTNFNIKDVILYDLDTFSDERGQIWTLFDEKFCDKKFIADKLTISKKNVLRGFHGDSYTEKLISCLSGEFQFSILDLRKNSETYGMTDNFIFNSNNPQLIYIPAGLVNAHLCLSDECLFYYKWSESYKGPENQITIKWNDKKIKTEWKTNNPFLSERDKNGILYEGIYL